MLLPSAMLAFTVAASGDTAALSNPLRLAPGDAEKARVLAGRVAMRLSPETQLGFAFSEGPEGLAAHMQGQDRPAFMIAGDAAGDTGFEKSEGSAVALRRSLGATGLTLTAGGGDVWLGNYRLGIDVTGTRRERYPFTRFGVAADRQIGPVSANVGIEWLREDRTVLGAYLNDSFGARGADSLFLDTSIGLDLASDLRLGASLRQGMTRAHSGGLVAGGSTMRSAAWSLDLVRENTLRRGDAFGFRLSQPLRVEAGGLSLNLPVDYDYATQETQFGIRTLSLAPSGREVMGELNWRTPLWGGGFSASAFYRRQPGHYAQAPDDQGLLVRFSRGF